MAILTVALLACSLLAAASSLPHVKYNKKSFDTMIVGGEPAYDGELPYQISLLRNLGGHYCGGSLVLVGDTQLVITAAHCVEPGGSNLYFVVAGDVTRSDITGVEQVRDVTGIIQHPEYNELTSENDIALLLFDEPFNLNQYVAPIPLPRQGQQTSGDVVVSGWGATGSGGSLPDVLQKVQIPVVDDATCQRAYQSETIADSMLCAGLIDEGGKDSCQGDSGGPLRSIEGGYLAGIVSWGFGCAQPGYPGVNTEVAYYITWIEEQVAKL